MHFISQYQKTLLGILLLVPLYGCEQAIEISEPVARPIPVFEVSGDSTEQRTFTGRARAAREANLAARVPGTLIKLHVKVGDMIKAGDILTEIDPQDFRNGLNSARGNLAQVKSDLEFAQREFQRILGIKKTNPDLVSPSRFDLIQRNLRSAKAGLIQAESAVKQASDNLRYTKLKAPFDGQISTVLVENFEEVAPKQPLVRILDTAKIEMVIDIPEQLISSASSVFDIKVKFDAFSDLFIPASIKEISSEADPVSRTYPITLIMDQPKGATILSGMAGRASGKVSRETQEQGFTIPTKALGHDAQGQSFVWKVSNDGTLSKRILDSVLIRGNGVTVKGNVKPGDLLALAGIYSIDETTLVKPYKAGQ